MIRPVNLRMTVHAASSDRTVARGGDLPAVVNRRGMTARNVAALAEHRLFRDQHAIVVRAVRIVTTRTVLAAGRVIPHEWTALLGVAAGARFVERVADFQHPDVIGSVRAVAGRAVHLAFAQRHVARLLHLHRFLLVASRAGFHRRRRLQLRLFGFRTVDAVAGRARDVARIVHAALEVGVGTPVMAREARFVGVPDLHDVEPADVFFLARIDVLLAGAMAGFARLPGARRRRTAVLCLAVERRLQALAFGFVARGAGLIADEALGLCGWCCCRSRGGCRLAARLISSRPRTGGRNPHGRHPDEHECGRQQACRKTVTWDTHD